MRLNLGQPAALERARDCFLVAAKIMDVRCEIAKAERAWRRDPKLARLFLKEAAVKSVELSRLFPERADQAKAIGREAKGTAERLPPKAKKRLPIGKDAEISQGITRAMAELEEVYAASKIRCGVL